MRQLASHLNVIHLGVWILTLGVYGLGSLLVFFQFCLASEWEECENIEWVEYCQQKSLSPTNTHIEDDIVNEGPNVTFALEDYGHISDLI